MGIHPSPSAMSADGLALASRLVSGENPRWERNRNALTAPSLPSGIPSRYFFPSAAAAAASSSSGRDTARTASPTRSRGNFRARAVPRGALAPEGPAPSSGLRGRLVLFKLFPREIGGRGNPADAEGEVVGVGCLPERLLEGDQGLPVERHEGLVECLSPGGW